MRYRSADEDSARWDAFDFRRGDIVISTRSKSGTTWMQMICALLVFRTTQLPAPLVELSPWLDWLGTPAPEVYRVLERQEHRRFIKTHTPLDGLPLDEQATFIVVGRHPLDMAASLYHQGENLDRARMQELTGSVPPVESRPDLRTWLREWIEWEGPVAENLDSLPGVFWHLGDAWLRRNEANVLLVHYDDLLADLPGEMRRVAGELRLEVAPELVGDLAEAATFDAMRANSEALAPDQLGVLRDRRKFFRRGGSGAAREVLTAEDMSAYHERAGRLASPDLLAWLHRT